MNQIHKQSTLNNKQTKSQTQYTNNKHDKTQQHAATTIHKQYNTKPDTSIVHKTTKGQTIRTIMQQQ